MFNKVKRIISLLIAGLALFVSAPHTMAQSDVEEMNYLQLKGIDVTEGNSVKLLMSGHDKFEDMLEDDPNSLFKDSAFLKIFTSFIGEDNKKDDEIENFEEDLESFEDE